MLLPILPMAFIIIAYLLGSLSSAIIVCKLMRLPDPRSQGSGNPGATNVMRIGGKKVAIIVLLGDILKGVIPVLLAKLYGLPPAELAWIALAAFVGHLFPIFFGFRGGKGVATGFGVFLVLAWPLALAALTVWILIIVVTRYVSLAAVLTAIITPVLSIWLSAPGTHGAILIICLVLVVRHYENIQRLLAGKEDKFNSYSR